MKKDILIWFTNIKDEYVLNAAKLGQTNPSAGNLSAQQHSSKKSKVPQTVTSSAKGTMNTYSCGKQKAGKRLETDSRTTPVWLFAGLGIAAAAFLTFSGIQMIKWFGNQDSPLKTPMTLDSLPEETTTETAISLPLPIDEDECLAISFYEDGSAYSYTNISYQAGRFGSATPLPDLMILNQKGEIITTIEHAIINPIMNANGNSYSSALQNGLVISVNEPLPIMVQDEDGTFLAGLYSVSENDWLIEQTYVWMEILSDNLCTNSVALEGGDPIPWDNQKKRAVQNTLYEDVRLMRLDGTIIASEEENYDTYTRIDNYITDASHIYDLDGTLLCTYDGLLRGSWDGNLLITDKDNVTVLQDISGNIIWSQDPAYTFAGRIGNYLNWQTSLIETEEYMITDLYGNQVSLHYNPNIIENSSEADLSLKKAFIANVSPDYTQVLAGCYNENGTMVSYYLCDSALETIRYICSSLPESEIKLTADTNCHLSSASMLSDYDPSAFCEAWSYSIVSGTQAPAASIPNEEQTIADEEATIPEDLAIRLTNIWTNETYTVKINSQPSSLFVNQLGEILLISLTYDSSSIGICYANDDVIISDTTDAYRLQGTLERDTVIVTGFENADNLYLSADGTPLEFENDSSILYADTKFYCMQDGSTLIMKDYSGREYLRVETTLAD